MLDMVKELNRERHGPPLPVAAARSEPAAKRPESNQHHDGISVVQRFGLDQPRIEIPEKASRLRHRPCEHVDLKDLQQMFGPVRQYDGDEQSQRQLMPFSVESIG